MTTNMPTLEVNHRYRSPGRTLTESDFSQFHNLCWTISEAHTNEEFARRTKFGGRVLPGPCLLAIALGLDFLSDFRLALRSEGKQLQVILEYENVRFLAPVRPGDTVHLETDIQEIRDTKTPGRQVLRMKDYLINQNEDTVMENLRTVIIGDMQI